MDVIFRCLCRWIDALRHFWQIAFTQSLVPDFLSLCVLSAALRAFLRLRRIELKLRSWQNLRIYIYTQTTRCSMGPAM